MFFLYYSVRLASSFANPDISHAKLSISHKLSSNYLLVEFSVLGLCITKKGKRLKV